MSHQRPPFHASLLRLWEYTVVQVPDAGGVHAIVPDGGDPTEVARAAVALVLGIELDKVTVVVTADYLAGSAGTLARPTRRGRSRSVPSP